MDQAYEFAIQPAHRIAIGALSMALFGMIVELMRREYLKERYALLWLATSTGGLVIGVFPSLIARFAAFVNFQLVTTLFVVSFLYVLGIVLGFSVIISRLAERNRLLAQEVALMGQRVERLETERNEI